MIKASCKKHILKFKQPSGTSRGILKIKETYFIIVSKNNKIGIGECGLFRGLSFDDVSDYETKLQWVCDQINLGLDNLHKELYNYPSIQFGLEQALLSLKSQDKFELFPSKFTLGLDSIPINGLIWMGSNSFMKNQIKEKLKAGFSTIKMKIGAIDFDEELALLKSIRNIFSSKEVELRVDANGAFHPKEALEKLKKLSDLEIHSIEQPIKKSQYIEMAHLCEKTPIPIALDEELIGITTKKYKKKLLRQVKPQYIILKPSLVGGIRGSNEWIKIAENNKIGWWITSALESNVGLNAIAQYTYTLKNKLPQGLGTGNLFTNNITSPLQVSNGALHYDNSLHWDFNL